MPEIPVCDGANPKDEDLISTLSRQRDITVTEVELRHDHDRRHSVSL